MSALKYNTASLLEGKTYRSPSRGFEGVITYAEKREGIWYGENNEAYVITVRPQYVKGAMPQSDFYATICVSN